MLHSRGHGTIDSTWQPPILGGASYGDTIKVEPKTIFPLIRPFISALTCKLVDNSDLLAEDSGQGAVE